MSCLSVYHHSAEIPNKVLTHAEDIAATLAEQGIGFQAWHARVPVVPGVSVEELLMAYDSHLEPWAQQAGATQALSIDGGTGKDTGLDAEHSYPCASTNLFVAGRAVIYLHVGDYVFAVLCEKGDLLKVPAGVAHWLDLGDHPRLALIRVFAGDAQASLTGNDIANRFCADL